LSLLISRAAARPPDGFPPARLASTTPWFFRRILRTTQDTKVVFDNANPLAYGMPPEGLALHMSGSPAFEIIPGEHNERYEVVVRYADRDLLESGWLIGEQTLARKAGMVAAKYGDGRVILIGFRTQHRAQTHGTFKLLFNALIR